MNPAKVLHLAALMALSMPQHLSANAAEPDTDSEPDAIFYKTNKRVCLSSTRPTRPRPNAPAHQHVYVLPTESGLAFEFDLPEGLVTVNIHEPLKGISHLLSFDSSALWYECSLPQLDEGSSITLETENGDTYIGIL